MASSSSYSNPPCAACKFLRRKCVGGCVFAPYFPPEEPQKFANVHKIFGASNVSKLLNEIQPHQREDAVNSLAYEAEARLKDPVYGCVGAISILQRQVVRLQKELDATNADIIKYATSSNNIRSSSSSSSILPHSTTYPSGNLNNSSFNHTAARGAGRRNMMISTTTTTTTAGSSFGQIYDFVPPPYNMSSWNNINSTFSADNPHDNVGDDI